MTFLISFRTLRFVLGPLLFAVCLFGQPHLDLNGNFNYLLNRPPVDAFVTTPDARIAVVMTAVISPNIGAQITTFDVLTRMPIDTKFAGFGPLQVQLTKAGDIFKVVALTSRGGPNTVTIFDMDDTGHLTFRAERQLTTSGSDERSNVVLSARNHAGFVRVRSGQNVSELVSFSLDSGAILQHAPLPVSDILALYEDPVRSFIASGAGTDLYFINVNDPSNMAESGHTVLPGTGGSSFPNNLILNFSSDGNLVFAGGDGAKLSCVDTTTFNVRGSFAEPFSTINLAVSETRGRRLVALYGGNDVFLGLTLIDASDPSDLLLLSQRDLRQEIYSHRDMVFSSDERTIILTTGTPFGSLDTLRVPQLVPLIHTSFSPAISFDFTVKTFGDPEYIYGAWQSDDNALGRIYFLPNRINTFASFDLDGKSDIGTFGGSKVGWRWLRSSDGKPVGPVSFGEDGDIPLPADYDGDSLTDLAVFDRSRGEWRIRESSTGNTRIVHLGVSSDLPVPADYDGDGKTDVAVFRSSPNRWLFLKSSDGQLLSMKGPFGKVRPVTGDFDGDGKADLASFSRGTWNIRLSSGGQAAVSFGGAGDIPLSGDFDYDGRSDIGIFSPSTGMWRIQETYAGLQQLKFGESTDLPIPADYDGDGRTDIALYRPIDSTFRIVTSTNVGVIEVQFGSPGDRPVTFRY